MSASFSPTVIDSLLAAGWHEGRCVSTKEYENLGCELFPTARQVLQEFAGLHIGNCGPGRECATSDVNIDPLLATHLAEELRGYGRRLGTQLYALGDFQHSHGYILIDEFGKSYLLNDEMIPFAQSFADALEKLICGLLPDPQDGPGEF